MRTVISGAFAMDIVDRQRLRPRMRDDLIRLGPAKDGGYVVPAAAVERTSLLISLGMKRDWSFEVAFVAANAAVRVIGVDPSVGPWFFARQIGRSLAGMMSASLSGDTRSRRRHFSALLNGVDYFWFFRLKHRHVAKRVAPNEGPGHVRLDDLMASARETGHRVFLKMDIEGAEYGLVPDILRHHSSINGIVVEFHRVGKRAAVFNDAVAGLQRQFQVVHVHGNNYRPYDTRQEFPDTVEMTFLNTALISEPAVAAPWEYPRPGLDFPNLASQSDYRLRFD